MLEGISPPSLDDAFVDPNRHETVLASHMPAKGLDLAAAQRDGGCGQDVELEEVAGLPVVDVAELDLEFVQHVVDLDVGLPELGAEVAFPYRIAAELFRSEEQTFVLPSLMRISYAVFCLKQ